MTERSTSRLFVLAVLVMSLVFTLAARAFSLQLGQSGEMAQAAIANRVRQVDEPAVRGLVLDQAGRVLAGNRVALDITASRRALRNAAASQATFAELGQLLDEQPAMLADRMRNCGTPGASKQPNCWNGIAAADPIVARDVSVTQAAAIMEQPDRYAGLSVTRDAVREYPLSTVAAQTLGYTAEVSAADIAADPTLAGTGEVGRAGLESQYDQELRGTPGRSSTAVDSAGRVVKVAAAEAAQPGKTLVTSIDAKLQTAVEKALRKAMARTRGRLDSVTGQPFRADTGAAVVLDVRSGRVLALASEPGYDATMWVAGISTSQYAALTAEDSGLPLLNRAVQAAAPPASTFKVVTTAAALQNGFSGTDAYPCISEYRAGGRSFQNYESRAYGPITFARALEISCDTVYYQVADRLWHQDGGSSPTGTPQDAIATLASSFGLGRRTGVDLPGEAIGSVASRRAKAQAWTSQNADWCTRAKSGYPDEESPTRAKYLQALAKENCAGGMLWRVGDAVNAAIGQGDTTVTPLQLAVAYAAIANGGTLWKPQVARALLNADGTVEEDIAPSATGQLPVSAGDLAYIRTALRGVIERGSARKVFASFPTWQVALAGKTGTAEVYGQQTTSWFASFAPANDPQYAVVAMVTNAGTGAGTSGRAVEDIYKALFGVRNGRADPDRGVLSGGAPASELPKLVNGIPEAAE
ncbi:MAG: penicillin-binding protein 2 [Candidatus Nanopelagicales bacterium]